MYGIWTVLLFPLIQAQMPYSEKKLNLHSGVAIHEKGEVMLGEHNLDIYIPITLRDYQSAVERFFIFLARVPNNLHFQLLGLQIMNDNSTSVEELKNASYSSSKLYPWRNITPLLKTLYTLHEAAIIQYNKKLKEKWEHSQLDKRKTWSEKLICLSKKQVWLGRNWNILKPSTILEEGDTQKIPRCFAEGSTLENPTILSSSERTLEEISITLLTRLKHVELEYRNLVNIYGPAKASRKRRGLINAVGDLEKWLFGTATEGDLSKIQEQMVKLKDSETKIIHAMGSLEAIVEKETKRANMLANHTRTLEEQMAHVSRDVIKLYENTQRTERNLKIERLLQTYTQVMQQAALGLDVLETEIVEFLQDLDKVNNHMLSSSLITPQELEKIMEKVCDRLPTGKSCNFNKENDSYLQIYQETRASIVTLPNTSKCVRLRVAINDQNSTVNVIKITKIPIPIELKSQQHIQPKINDQIMYGIREEFAVELSDDTWRKCVKFSNTPIQCPESEFTLVDADTLKCLKGITSKTPACDTEVINLKETSMFTHIQSGVGVYNFKKRKSVTLTCRDTSSPHTVRIPLFGYGILNYEASCDLVINNKLYIGSHDINSTYRLAMKGIKFETAGIPSSVLPKLKIWSQITPDTSYENIEDLRKIQSVAEKAIQYIDKEEEDFKPIEKMITQTKLLINQAHNETDSIEFFEQWDFGTWGTAICLTIIIIGLLILIGWKLKQRKNRHVNRIVEAFRRNLQERINETNREPAQPEQVELRQVAIPTTSV